MAVQLFGHEPDTMAAQAAWIEREMGQSLAYLDINMGCPARKIVSKGDGSALMKDPALAASIVRAVRAAVSRPVTVKFRRGWAEGDETAPEFARRMEDAVAITERTGCDAVMIARAAEGNPWLFAQAKAALAGEPEPDGPTVEERIALARRHARLLSAREGRNIVRMRKHAMWYLAGLPGAAAARGRINGCVSVKDFDEVFDELLACAREHAAAHE